MAAFRLRLYDRPAEELRWTVEGDVPRWVRRLYQSYGADVGDAPLSASVEALAEGLGERLQLLALALRKMERRGWSVVLEGDCLLVASDLTRQATVAALQADGVWTVVRELALGAGPEPVAWL
jgi:hypothetical protein